MRPPDRERRPAGPRALSRHHGPASAVLRPGCSGWPTSIGGRWRRRALARSREPFRSMSASSGSVSSMMPASWPMPSPPPTCSTWSRSPCSASAWAACWRSKRRRSTGSTGWCRATAWCGCRRSGGRRRWPMPIDVLHRGRTVAAAKVLALCSVRSTRTCRPPTSTTSRPLGATVVRYEGADHGFMHDAIPSRPIDPMTPPTPGGGSAEWLARRVVEPACAAPSEPGARALPGS